MKKVLTFAAALFAAVALFAQNDKADNIIGTYKCGSGKDAYKVKFEKQPAGTYKATICWVADPYEADGKTIALDKKNPDKSLRSTPMSKVVLIDGLKYNADKKRWDGAKIYDPNRGIKANVTIIFENAKTMKLRGTVMGIGETETWIKE